jgi:hypothetical protein
MKEVVDSKAKKTFFNQKLQKILKCQGVSEAWVI